MVLIVLGFGVSMVKSHLMVSLAIFDLINISCAQLGWPIGILVQSFIVLRTNDLQCRDTWLKLVQDSGFPRMLRENMLHNISAGRREIGTDSFLRDFRARIISSISRMPWSIMRVTSNGSPAEHEVVMVSSAIGSLN